MPACPEPWGAGAMLGLSCNCDLFRRCVLHVRQHVRIDTECKGNAGVAELLTDDLWEDLRTLQWSPPCRRRS